MMIQHSQLTTAAAAIRAAEALLIGAGAGMGVDSGLPDFRGNAGFWKAYPPLAKRGLSFVKLANPYWFHHDPQQAWGFYGHRRNLYQSTQPHAGFGILRKWAASMPAGWFVFTSNVDGHFQRAGFDEERIVECHGSLSHLQCMRFCTTEIWRAGDQPLAIDEATLRAEVEGTLRVPLPTDGTRSVPATMLPSCPRCGGLARPNVLMFGDGEWLSQRTEEQRERYRQWRRQIRGSRLVVIELGAGSAVPTVRLECESAGGTLIRINPREADVPPGGISLPLGALDALRQLDLHL